MQDFIISKCVIPPPLYQRLNSFLTSSSSLRRLRSTLSWSNMPCRPWTSTRYNLIKTDCTAGVMVSHNRQSWSSGIIHVYHDQVQVANNQQTYIRVANCQTVRMKEEKEVLEHFAGVFTMMNPLTFKEIFQTTVPYMVERISKNYALQACLVSPIKRK